MRRGRLFTQVLVVNAGLAAVVAVVATVLFDLDLRSPAGLIALAALAAATGAVVNLALLSNRFGPLESLIDEMEKVDLSSLGSGIPGTIDGSAETEEVERLELAFLRMAKRLDAEHRRASNAALQAQERERARVARDLHDEVNQSLTALLLRLEAAREAAPPELAEELTETKALANQAMRELLALARQLRPTALDDLGLEAALGGLVEQIDETGVSTSVEIDSQTSGASLADLSDASQLVIYRVAQEAISNAVRHSGANRVALSLRPLARADESSSAGEAAADGGDSATGAVLEVADNGRGFVFADSEQGLGLSGMRERALLVGGRLEIESRPGHGTTIRLKI